MATKKKVAGTIDCTPTWEAATRIYLIVLENGKDAGKKIAREELLRLAKAYDVLQIKYNALVDNVSSRPTEKKKGALKKTSMI